MDIYLYNTDITPIKEHRNYSKGLGQSILKVCHEKLDFKKRGIKFANFQVLRETANLCPAILIELGFITHKDEAYYFLKPQNIRAIALAILIGITNHLNMEL